jgi:hypothetical protein
VGLSATVWMEGKGKTELLQQVKERLFEIASHYLQNEK